MSDPSAVVRAGRRKVLLVGWDAADWRLINPLLDAGEMPALASVVARGTMGNLATIQPTLSPLVWNSIATGKYPHDHGILGFIEPDDRGDSVRPTTSVSRRTKALWEILDQEFLRCQVVAWFCSHPAEAIRGTIVSDRFALPPPQGIEEWPLAESAVFPAESAAALHGLRVHPTEITADELLPFVPRLVELDRSNPVLPPLLGALARSLAQTATVQAVTTHLLETEDWDFTAVYFRALDELGHHFMRFAPPAGPGVSAEMVEAFGGVIDQAYRFHDFMLGRLLHLAGPEATIILLSDHGFQSGASRPASSADDPSTMAQWHRPLGILAMAGPGLLRDERLYGATILDIAPTVLNLFGLPVGADMPGRVLSCALAEPHPPARIPSWETVPPLRHSGMTCAADPLTGRDVLRHLAELGYLDFRSVDGSTDVAASLAEMAYNRAASLSFAGQTVEAEAAARRLVVEYPAERRYRSLLAVTLMKLGRSAEARRELEVILEGDETDASAHLLLAASLAHEHRGDEALVRLNLAAQLGADGAPVHEQAGRIFLQRRQWPEAEAEFRRVLEIEPDSPQACVGLAHALARQERNDEALSWALEGVGMQHFLPSGHLQIGAILAKRGELEAAAAAFRMALSMQPGNLVAHRFLARLYLRLGRHAEAAAHRVRADQLAGL